MSFDLDSYLARLTLGARPSPDAEGLARLQRAHRLAIPFENLDVMLGRAIALDSDSVFAKLVTARRGGYCFEHNRLFRDGLAALGFVARPLLGRVWLLGSDTPGLTHTLSLVTIDGQDWIADPGFGGSYTPPMPLVDGATAMAPDGAAFRLDADPVYGWMLSRDGGQGWQRQYSFTLAQVWDADLAMGNHWCATAPVSRFTKSNIVSIVLPNGFASLQDRDYKRRNGSDETSAEITDPRVYKLRLSMMFGIDLGAEEIAALGVFAAA
ncbi:arylamine N-acetyltransferase family protein [Sphingomonas endolithica]|uniref:arylamine N-acetyltransferase family protein n=1 Tax=Sphingomonas endolithica TaxID=2972485 RepID=UPI0021AEDEC9|nr:arylamine N-acetyltransferase [Sphingomonas sp. ZFBP2030]